MQVIDPCSGINAPRAFWGLLSAQCRQTSKIITTARGMDAIMYGSTGRKISERAVGGLQGHHRFIVIVLTSQVLRAAGASHGACQHRARHPSQTRPPSLSRLRARYALRDGESLPCSVGDPGRIRGRRSGQSQGRARGVRYSAGHAAIGPQSPPPLLLQFPFSLRLPQMGTVSSQGSSYLALA